MTHSSVPRWAPLLCDELPTVSAVLPQFVFAPTHSLCASVPGPRHSESRLRRGRQAAGVSPRSFRQSRTAAAHNPQAPQPTIQGHPSDDHAHPIFVLPSLKIISFLSRDPAVYFKVFTDGVISACIPQHLGRTGPLKPATPSQRDELPEARTQSRPPTCCA